MDERADYVLGLNPAARLLAAMTPRGRVRSVLDVGTGCGVQAFLAAAHSERVVATDICLRALHFAAFNAKLNGIGNVEFRHGSLFEPVAGEEFEVVVANPPYVISPDRTYVFRDGGLPGESICARLAESPEVELQTFRLADGTLFGAGANERSPAGGSVHAILGGTGRYAATRGTFSLTPLRQENGAEEWAEIHVVQAGGDGRAGRN